MSPKELDMPERKFRLDEIKRQAATLTVSTVDFVYETFAHQVKQGFVPNVVEDNLPERFKVFSEDDLKRNGKVLVEDYVNWFNEAPRAKSDQPPDIVELPDIEGEFISPPARLENFQKVISTPASQLTVTKVIATSDRIRDKLHRDEEFRDTWLLHKTDTIIEVDRGSKWPLGEDQQTDIESEEFLIKDSEWREAGMNKFTLQVRKVLDNLDIDRDARETMRRQREMRRLLRMAGMRPTPIIEAPITGRPQPVLDRIRE